ncbi:MAG: peptidylprolyl isomerase [Bacteroidaceae bacterium]|nr:peptidylprolyl isomerase [Bacteroidaceae bacterium]
MRLTKFLLISMAAGLTATAAAMAETDDPVVMRINGQDVTRSEFEYNYNKNNTDDVIDRKTVAEYADLFINYKLKVCAALDAHLDTLSSYQQEFRTYRDQQIRPLLVAPEAEEAEARAYYDKMLEQMDGKQLLLPAHIFVRLPQQGADEAAAKTRIDSIYALISGGADFAETARQCSEDPQTGQRGGVIGWIGPHSLLKEIEDKLYAMQVGETSEPVKSTVGWHILRLNDQRPLEPYDTLAPRIRTFLEQRGLKDRLAQTVIDSLATKSGEPRTVEAVMDDLADTFAAKDDDLKYLIQEYHDGLLLYEVCQRQVWEPAARDTAALEAHFKANKKAYAYAKPHYAGALLQARDKATLAAARKALKGMPEERWAETIKTRFNADSVQVRFERRVFEQGDNAMVDSLAFGIRQGKTRPSKTFPAAAVVGRKLKKGPQRWTDVGSQVVTDYQSKKEAEFVEELRRRYSFEVFTEALSTVNNH